MWRNIQGKGSIGFFIINELNYDEALSEMHALAYIYHWGYSDIVKLDRAERRIWVNLILEQQERERKQLEEK